MCARQRAAGELVGSRHYFCKSQEVIEEKWLLGTLGISGWESRVQGWCTSRWEEIRLAGMVATR